MTGNTHLIGGVWQPGDGPLFQSENPATGEVVWSGHAAPASLVDEAVAAARGAFAAWADKSPEERIDIIRRFGEILDARRQALALTIAREVGKPLWESRTEIGAMIGKIAISIKAYGRRTPTASTETAAGTTTLTHRPHGVMAVFGPFNFPGHLPNGHIIPALIAGNTVVFKPSELTPHAGQEMVACWTAAGLPDGVVNLVQGGRDSGIALAGHDAIDGLLFTGSSATGRLLHKQFGGRPEKILALEMGGNNPLIVIEPGDAEAAAYIIAQSAYITTGQRCSCARRLIVPVGAEGDAIIAALETFIKRLSVGPAEAEPAPFMGPLISNASAEQILRAEDRLSRMGGRKIVALTRPDAARPFLTPGLIDVTDAPKRPDEEYFGPLLQVIRINGIEAAIAEANATRYGLSAGIVTANTDYRDLFRRHIRAGIVNWNKPLTGASSAAPFGGTGLSGNHRPGAFYAADYCAWPMAGIESETVALPDALLPGIA